MRDTTRLTIQCREGLFFPPFIQINFSYCFDYDAQSFSSDDLAQSVGMAPNVLTLTKSQGLHPFQERGPQPYRSLESIPLRDDNL